MMIRFTFIVLAFIPLLLQAQEKREVERKVNASQVPEHAREWLDEAYDHPQKVHWYEEDHSGEQSFEAKFKWKKKWHSVKFSPEGIIEDIEIKIHRQEIPPQAREKIWEYLNSNYTRFKIKKIQLQWTGGEDQLLDALHNENPDGVTTRYEIEYHGRNSKENELWEGLFDNSGALLKRSKIILIPTDNLTY